MISSCRYTDEHPPLLRSTPFKGGRSGEASCSRGCVSKANVSYEYRGDGKRHSRTAGGVTTRYGWDMGWNVIHEESAGGTLQRSFVGDTLAHVDGTNPALGTWTYYLHDHLGSVRQLRNQARAHVASRQYNPYGDIQSESGTFTATRGFTGHDLDASTGLYYAPYRYYSPALARWTTRDPLGMIDGPNVYAYVRGNPVNMVDPLGLMAVLELFAVNSFSSQYEHLDNCDIPSRYLWCVGKNGKVGPICRVATEIGCSMARTYCCDADMVHCKNCAIAYGNQEECLKFCEASFVLCKAGGIGAFALPSDCCM